MSVLQNISCATKQGQDSHARQKQKMQNQLASNVFLLLLLWLFLLFDRLRLLRQLIRLYQCLPSNAQTADSFQVSWCKRCSQQHQHVCMMMSFQQQARWCWVVRRLHGQAGTVTPCLNLQSTPPGCTKEQKTLSTAASLSVFYRLSSQHCEGPETFKASLQKQTDLLRHNTSSRQVMLPDHTLGQQAVVGGAGSAQS